MQFQRFLGKLLLATFSLMSAATAGADVIDDIKARGTLLVGGKTDYKPFGFRQTGGDVVGFSVDLARKVAEKLGVRLEIVPTTAANQIQFLEQGKVDVLIAAMNDTPERRKVVQIVDPGYYASGANLLVLKKVGVRQWADLKDKKICAVQGAYYNRVIEQEYGASLVSLKATTEAYNALRNGACIGFVYDDNSLTLKLEEAGWQDYEVPLQSIVPQPVAMAVRLGEERFHRLLTELSIDWYRTGYIRAMEERWFPGKRSSYVQDMTTKHSK